jgi:UDP-2-acetamido-3-amino-2,3-dideoxy-glucuronate N-acetyltransferase
VERHPSAIIESKQVGINTKIGANAHILAGAIVGENCEIAEGVIIHPGAVIGRGVRIGSGALIESQVTIEDEVVIGACAVFTNDGGAGVDLKSSMTLVHAGAVIGANSTVLRGAKIGHKANISAGSVVSQTIPQNAIVVGNPAQIVGYVNSPRLSVAGVTKLEVESGQVYSSKVNGVSVIRLPSVPDIRGSLSFGEFQKHIPFESKRFFLIYDVPSKELRGEHAHKANHQFLICVNGSVNALVDDGKTREEFVLDSPSIGIHIPPMVWGTQYKYSEGAILLVFASHLYEANDYIRDYQDFLAHVG